MRLPIVLGLAATLSVVSCQDKSKSKENVKVEKIATEMSKEEFLGHISEFSKKVEKALMVEVDNTKKAKRIITFIKDSRLTPVECKKAVFKVMDKLTLPIEEQKEIIYIMDADIPN